MAPPPSPQHEEGTHDVEAASQRNAAPPNPAREGPQRPLPHHLLIERNLSYVRSSLPALPIDLLRGLLISTEPPNVVVVAAGGEARNDDEINDEYAQRLSASLSPSLDAQQTEAIEELSKALSLALASPCETAQASSPSTPSSSSFSSWSQSQWHIATERLSQRLDLASADCLSRPPRLAHARMMLDIARDEARKLELSLKAERKRALRPPPSPQQSELSEQLRDITSWQARLLLASANIALLQGRASESKRFLTWRTKALSSLHGADHTESKEKGKD